MESFGARLGLCFSHGGSTCPPEEKTKHSQYPKNYTWPPNIVAVHHFPAHPFPPHHFAELIVVKVHSNPECVPQVDVWIELTVIAINTVLEPEIDHVGKAQAKADVEPAGIDIRQVNVQALAYGLPVGGLGIEETEISANHDSQPIMEAILCFGTDLLIRQLSRTANVGRYHKRKGLDEIPGTAAVNMAKAILGGVVPLRKRGEQQPGNSLLKRIIEWSLICTIIQEAE